MSKEATLAAGSPPVGRKKKGKLVIILATVVGLAAAGAGGGFWYLQRSKAANAADAPKKAERRPARVFATLEPFTVNLRASGGSEHFLQLGVIFEVSGSEVSEAIKANMPLLRGKVLLLLSGKTSEELAGSEGKIRLAAELVAVARYALQGAPALGDTPIEKAIADAHFSSMIIQ